MYEPDNNPFAAESDSSSPTSQRYSSLNFNNIGSAGAEGTSPTTTDRPSTVGGDGSDDRSREARTNHSDGAEAVEEGVQGGTSTCGCRIESVLARNADLSIGIQDAGKSNEGSGGSFIAYTIQVGVRNAFDCILG